MKTPDYEQQDLFAAVPVERPKVAAPPSAGIVRHWPFESPHRPIGGTADLATLVVDGIRNITYSIA